MKEAMIEAMLALMPFMKPFMWAGVIIAVLGIVLLLVQLAFKSNTHTAIKWTTMAVFMASVFFIFAQIAGYALNMTPAINLGDSSKFEFILVSFWKIGVGFLLISLLLKFVGGAGQEQTP